jgi:hypothetical protein
MAAVVAPLLQAYAVPPLAVKLTDEPVQIVFDPELEILATGNAFTITVLAVEVPEHPAALVTCTV